MNQEIYLIFLSAYALTGIVVLPKNISGLSFPTPSGRWQPYSVLLPAEWSFLSATFRVWLFSSIADKYHL